MRARLRGVVALPLLLAACAIGDSGSSSTPLPPITLQPPPPIAVDGLCDNTPQLETWLQITTRLADDFMTVMNEAAGKDRAAAHEAVYALAVLRDATHETRTPDCAVDAEVILSDAMNTAISAFQAYANGDSPDLGNTVATVSELIEEAMAMQNELIQRMEEQIRQAQPPPP